MLQPRSLLSRRAVLRPNKSWSRVQSDRALRRRYATVTDPSNWPSPGEQLHGFTLRRVQQVPELRLTAVELEHNRTGAEYLHLARDDANNVFSIGFKTNPPDDTGVPHILEHTTLCGSKAYPVRDPFFKMLPRSLSNFMNAMTASDHTFYPFATTNEKDFKNLLSVYLDSTLRPLLQEDDFAQEGWRIGPESVVPAGSEGVEKAKDDLVFKGVVYNEMKGQMSDASYLYYTRWQDHIFPAINNSGGDPQKMTDLTYADLKSFHANHYHPSNAKIFTYGNMPLGDHLQEIDRQLETFERNRSDSVIKEPISISEPKDVVVQGPIDPLVDPAMQYKTSVAWVLGDTSEVVENFSLGILSSLLLNGYGSPLYRALIESGIGPDFSANTGLDSHGKTGIFSVGLNGVTEENVPKVKAAIQQTLQDVRQKGFDKHKVEGLLHQLEIGLKHKTANFGMNMMYRLQPSWFNGVDPFEALALNKTVNEFKRRFEQGGYLESLLDKYLLNDRTLTFTMEPSATFGEDLIAEEKERLRGKIEEVTQALGGMEKAKKQLEQQEVKLLEIQDAARKQSLDCLPMVHVADIPRQMERKPVRDSDVNQVKVQWREAPTNGLTYFKALHNLDGLPTELKVLVPLFCDSIMRLGTKDKTMEQIEDWMKQATGGVSTSTSVRTRADNADQHSFGLAFSGFAMDENVPTMYEILRTVTHETDFDGPKAEMMISQLLEAYTNGALDNIASSGHAFARAYAQSKLRPGAALDEQLSGLTYVQHIANVARQAKDGGLAGVIAGMKRIQEVAIFNSADLRVALTCGSEAVSQNEAALQRFLSTLPQSTSLPNAPQPKPSAASNPPQRGIKTFFPLPYQVYYTGLALPTVPFTHADSPPLKILQQLLTHKHLHHEIREKGGAYGAGAFSNSISGVFGFSSYRDPSPQASLAVMRGAGRWALDREWSALDLEEAKLSTFQAVDAPASVNQEGMTRFLDGIDEDAEQQRRERLLDVSVEDVKRVAQKYVAEGAEGASVAVIGERKDWVKDDEGWEVKQLNV